MKLHLHIDRVVLDGITPGDRAAFEAALTRELTTRFAAGGLAPEFAQGAALPHLRAPRLTLPESAGTSVGGARLGEAVAGAVHQSLTGDGGRR